MHRSEISLANYPVRLLLFRSKRIESGFGFILIECPCPKNYFYNFSRLFHCSIIKVLAICFRLESLIFPRKTDCFLCFRFVVSLPRQQILSYQIISCLSTLFLTFFILLFKVFVASTSYILSNGSTFVNTFFKFSFVFFKTALLCICSRFKFLCWILSQCRQEQFIYQYNKWGKNENPCLWIPHFPSFIHSP